MARKRPPICRILRPVIRETHRPLASSHPPPGSESADRAPPGRHVHWQLLRRRPHLVRRGSVVALLAVVGPGVLAGLSDDDPAGISSRGPYPGVLLWLV